MVTAEESATGDGPQATTVRNLEVPERRTNIALCDLNYFRFQLRGYSRCLPRGLHSQTLLNFINLRCGIALMRLLHTYLRSESKISSFLTISLCLEVKTFLSPLVPAQFCCFLLRGSKHHARRCHHISLRFPRRPPRAQVEKHRSFQALYAAVHVLPAYDVQQSYPISCSLALRLLL